MNIVYKIEGLIEVGNDDGCLVIAVRDREQPEERYVITSLNEKQSKDLIEALKG